MSQARVALLRGINVGKAKRVPMEQLREVISQLGYSQVSTILNSGNAVFVADDAGSVALAESIRAALLHRTGVDAAVTVVTGDEIESIARSNPLLDIMEDPSRMLVAFPSDDSTQGLKGLLGAEWSPEAVALGRRAAYLWCPAGVLKSQLPQEVGRLLGDAVTIRNWSTVLKIRDRLASTQKS